MSQTMWYLTRASGIVATVLMLAALTNGFLFSARETGKRLRPAWWLDLHNGIGGYALIFTGVHLVTAYTDSDLSVGLRQLLLPGTAKSDTAAFTWGVLAFYGLAVAVLTSWPRKRGRRSTWHLIHLLSIPATILACIHAYELGSDGKTTGFKVLLLTCIAVVVYTAGLRLTGLRSGRRATST